jgi:hypothetical protein
MAIEFNNETHEERAAQAYAQIQTEKKAVGFEQWLINKGIVGDKKQADMVLVLVSAVFFAITLFVIFRTIVPSSPQLTPDEIRQIEINSKVGL